MLKNFVTISIKDPTKGTTKENIQTRKSVLLEYPCDNPHVCTPYVVSLHKGVYRFECWGSKGGQWVHGTHKSTPGLGSYTAGTLFLSKATTFYVYIGNTGFFNAVKETRATTSAVSGGATDVRLNYSENWWDDYSLISRIMVSAGGGGAEWADSVGGNGGCLEGGESTFIGNDIDYHCL